MATDQEVIDSLKTDWTAEDFYNVEDINRVEEATRIVKERLEAFRSMVIILNIVNNRDETHIEFADSLNRIESNIAELKRIINNLDHLLDTMKTDWIYDSPFDYNDAIRLERNLKIMYDYIEANEENIPYCGQYTTGQEGVF